MFVIYLLLSYFISGTNADTYLHQVLRLFFGHQATILLRLVAIYAYKHHAVPYKVYIYICIYVYMHISLCHFLEWNFTFNEISLGYIANYPINNKSSLCEVAMVWFGDEYMRLLASMK